MFNVSLLDKSSIIKLLADLMLAVEHLTLTNHLSHDLDQFYLSHNIHLSLRFLVSRIFIMSKHHLDHLSLTESIFAESVQMSSLCDCCTHLLFLCVLADSS